MGDGRIGHDLCECMLKFRAYNRMIDGGFVESIIDFVDDPSYVIPICSGGPEVITYYEGNVIQVMDKGLNLFIFSNENGRGKTTVAHHVVYSMTKFMSMTSNYKRDRTFCFRHSEDLMREMRSDSDPETWKSTVFVLDDMGREDRSSPWRKESVISCMQRVLHYRRDRNFPTIITSNYDPRSLSNIYEGILDSLLDIRPDGIIRGSVFRQIELCGPEDLRIYGKGGWPEGM